MRFTIYEKRKKLCFPVCPEVYGVVTAICGYSQYSKLVILAHVMCFAAYLVHPITTSSTIISTKPTAKPMVLRLEC